MLYAYCIPIIRLFLYLVIMSWGKALTIVWWSDGIDFLIPFLFPNFRKGFFPSPPLPKFWEWNYPLFRF